MGSKFFVSKVLSYSVLTWFWLLLAMSPMLVLVWFFQNFHLDVVTSFNLFLISMIGTLGAVYFLSPLLKTSAQPHLELKRAQWNTAFNAITWLKKHETTKIFLLFTGLMLLFLPLEEIWAWFYHLGLLSSDFNAFILLFALILPFFVIPTFFLICFYDSVIRPSKPTGTQVKKIINALYSTPEYTGEALESAKHNTFSVSGKPNKLLGAALVASLVIELVLVQLVDFRYISERFLTLLPFAMVMQAIAIIIALFIGVKKKTQLDEWFDIYKQTENIKPENKNRPSNGHRHTLTQVKETTEQIISKIEKSLVFRIVAIIGILLSLILTVLGLFHWV